MIEAEDALRRGSFKMGKSPNLQFDGDTTQRSCHLLITSLVMLVMAVSFPHSRLQHMSTMDGDSSLETFHIFHVHTHHSASVNIRIQPQYIYK